MKKTFLLLSFLLAAFFGFAQTNYNVSLLANMNYAINGESGNDVWGYVDSSGIEYAIAGSTQATYIYSLEDPQNPVLRARIPGANSTWRDIKDFNEYLYVVADVGTDGLLVINMSAAPDTITWEFYQPDVTVAGTTTRLNRCHNLYISNDGYAVLTGCNIYGGTPLFFDLNVDPEEPPFIGASRNEYAHDVFAENNRLYSSDIYAGEVAVHDYTDPTDIQLLGTATTSTTFTHNAWPTSNDSHVFTTDERSGAFVDAFDVTDPTNPTFLDKFRPDATYGSGSIPHNTHVLGEYLATSWYKDGVIITDASRPHNLVQVGQYDTYVGGGGGFEGCWGAYPFLPSGLLLASDINTGLYVFDVNYEKGCYFEGIVIDSVSRQPISGVTINFDNRAAQSTTSDISGEFATGIYAEGTYPVTFSRAGYVSKQLDVSMSRGVLNEIVVELRPLRTDNINVIVKNESNDVLPNAAFVLEYQGDQNGNNVYDVIAGSWGYLTSRHSGFEVDPNLGGTIEIILSRGYYDDFIFDFDWQVASTASTGAWERGFPLGTSSNGVPAQLGADLEFDFGGQAYVTGNNGTGPGDDDVDNGVTTLTSPVFDLSTYPNAALEFWYHFYNGGGQGAPNDALLVTINNGNESAVVANFTASTSDWTKYRSQPLSSIIALTSTMTVSFETSDLAGSGHLVEAMIDEFSISSVPRPTISFTPPTGCNPLTTTVTSDPASPNNTWIFDGADIPNAAGASPTVTYPEAGTYDVTLVVIDSLGNTSTFVYPNAIEVLQSITADFRTEIENNVVSFFNTSIGASSVLWDFGDGTTSTSNVEEHTYATSGDYTVTLTVEGPCGRETITQIISVSTNSSSQDFNAIAGLRLIQNPVNSLLTLDLAADSDLNIELRNSIGQQVLSHRLAAKSRNSLAVDHLPAGLYFLTSPEVQGAAIQVIILR